MNIPHIPVLLNEVLEQFSQVKDGIIVDCTVGYGGHSEALLKSKPNIKLICIDQDIEALEFSKNRLKPYLDRVRFYHGRFSDVLHKIEKKDQIRAILADIGVSSLQLDKDKRGFNFKSDSLDMRMDQSIGLTAYKVVNSYTLKELESIFRDYSDLKEWKKVASYIVNEREKKPFESSKELADFLAKKLHKKKIHPATLVFQAIRIEVNDELGELKRLLKSIRELKINKSIIAIISFHSLEDRIVKNYFREWSKSCICPKEAIRCSCGNNHAFGKIITKKPITPTEEEIYENQRSRSSKLRVFKIY